MLDSFLKYVKEQSLFHKNNKILLAVSGGIDSVVLAHLFAQSGVEFSIAHCNFSLRGEDSDLDQIFVENLSHSLNVKCHVRKFEIKAYADSRKVSIQMAARTLRYKWFEKLLKEHRYDYISTAHHHTDSVETVLFNLSKGTGIAGLRGILPKKENIIRPLLFANKDEIEAYAKTHSVKWREDLSNTSDKYHRNYIRHHVVPEFSKINPSFESSTKNTLRRLRDTELILLDYIEGVKKRVSKSKGVDIYLDISELNKLLGIATLLDQIISPYGFNYEQSKDIVRSLNHSGKLFYSSTHQINIDRKYIIISPTVEKTERKLIVNKGDSSLLLEGSMLELSEIVVPNPIPTDPNIGLFDLDKIQFPLVVRTWQQGDKFCPLGMTQSKKVSDFLIDNKVPLNLKERVKVLLSNDEIIWVIGYRIGDRVKINKSTNQSLQITVATVN